MKISCFLLQFLAMFCVLISVAKADSCGEGYPADSKCWSCGADCHAELDSSGEMHITGSGKMDNYFIDNTAKAPWQDYMSEITSLDIGKNITSIGAAAFSLASNLTELNIPDNITDIELFAFYGTGISKVTIPETIEFLGEQAFAHNDNLISVDCRNENILLNAPGETRHTGYAFADCPNIESFIIPDSDNISYLQLFGIVAFVFDDEFPENMTIYCDGDVEKCKQKMIAEVGGKYADRIFPLPADDNSNTDVVDISGGTGGTGSTGGTGGGTVVVNHNGNGNKIGLFFY